MVTASRPVYRIMFPGLILGILAPVVMIILGDIAQVGSHFIQFKWQYFLLALGFDVIIHLFRFFKHNFQLLNSGARGISFWQRLKTFLASAVLSATPLRVSESYKSVWLSQVSGIPLNAADTLQIIDRISEILSVLVLALAGTLAFPSLWTFFLLVFMLFLASSLSMQIKISSSRYVKSGISFPGLRNLSHVLFRSIGSIKSAYSFRSIIVWLVLGIFSWLAQGSALYCILIGLGLEPSLTLVSIACLTLAFSMLMGLVSRLPGGLGVIELAMAALLTILLNFRPDLAVAATILFRLATFWIDLLFGILFWSVASKSQGLNQEAGRIVQG